MSNNEDLIVAINESLPKFQANEIIKLLESNADDDKYYELAKKFTGETSPDYQWISTGSSSKSPKQNSFFDKVKDEVYSLFCTNDDKYSELRKNIDSNEKIAIGIIIGKIASILDVSTGFIAGAVTCFIVLICKVSKYAWCSLNLETK